MPSVNLPTLHQQFRFLNQISSQKSKITANFRPSHESYLCTKCEGTVMIGNAVRLGVMGALALVGSMQVVSIVPRCLASDPRVMSIEAQWKMATGDPEGAYQVVRRADSCRQSTTPVAHPTQARTSQRVASLTRG